MQLIAVTSLLVGIISAAGVCRPTASDILGPYYVPGAATKKFQVCSSATFANDRLVITGRVLSSKDCSTPIKARLDIWHANQDGKYSVSVDKGGDMECRAVIETNDEGVFKFETLMPGRYDDDGFRPAHVHFKISPADSKSDFKPLLTQMYFRNDAFLDNDSCKHCNSQDLSLVVDLMHLSDVKTFVGHWEVVLAVDGEHGVLDAHPDAGGPYTEQKEHIMVSSEDAQTLMRENTRLKQEVQQLKQIVLKKQEL